MSEPRPPFRITLKSGVIYNLTPEGAEIIPKAGHVYRDVGANRLVVTSINDSKHMTRSRHYDGDAVDLRIWGLTAPADVAKRLAAVLGPSYTVIFEKDHIHAQFNRPR